MWSPVQQLFLLSCLPSAKASLTPSTRARVADFLQVMLDLGAAEGVYSSSAEATVKPPTPTSRGEPGAMEGGSTTAPKVARTACLRHLVAQVDADRPRGPLGVSDEAPMEISAGEERSLGAACEEVGIGLAKQAELRETCRSFLALLEGEDAAAQRLAFGAEPEGAAVGAAGTATPPATKKRKRGAHERLAEVWDKEEGIAFGVLPSSEEERNQAIGLVMLLLLAGCGAVALVDRLMFPEKAAKFGGGACWCRICAGEVTLGRVLGEGGGGRVYTCTLQGELRVVKMININIDQDINALGDALEEAKNLIELQHKYIVTFFDFFFHRSGEDDGEEGRSPDYVCIVMELCDGGSLLDHITNGVPLDFDVLVTAFYQVIDALGHVHRQRMIHFDVKLENIFLTSSVEDRMKRRRRRPKRRRWNLKVGDFGLAVQNRSAALPPATKAPKERDTATARAGGYRRRKRDFLFQAWRTGTPKAVGRRVGFKGLSSGEKAPAKGAAPPEDTAAPLSDLTLSYESSAPTESSGGSPATRPKKYHKSAVVGGTAPYQAPECFDGTNSDDLTFKVDSWALGCALYEAVTCTSLPMEEPYLGQLALEDEEWPAMREQLGQKFHHSLKRMLAAAAAEKLSVKPQERRARQDERLRAALGLEELFYSLLQPKPEDRPELGDARLWGWWRAFKARPIYLPAPRTLAQDATAASSQHGADTDMAPATPTPARPSGTSRATLPPSSPLLNSLAAHQRAKSVIASPFLGLDWDLRPVSNPNVTLRSDASDDDRSDGRGESDGDDDDEDDDCDDGRDAAEGGGHLSANLARGWHGGDGGVPDAAPQEIVVLPMNPNPYDVFAANDSVSEGSSSEAL